MYNYFLATNTGVSSEDAKPSLGEGSENRSLSTVATKRKLQNLPIPCFLVPAILESLRSSARYGRLTRLVAGEADPFCAQAVEIHGGTLITSDSDLLLYDLGPDGNVVFLNDISISDPPSQALTTQESAGSAAQTRAISALVYNQHAILKNMGPKSGRQDLLAFAYELSMGSYSSLAQWTVEAARTQQSNSDAEDHDYQRFVARYQEPPVSWTPGIECLSFLDPRISEFVLSMSDDFTIIDPDLVGQSQRTPEFYLPQLLDRWDLRSAWTPGNRLRECAYEICGRRPNDDRPTVIEYRRALSESPQGQEVHLSGGEHAVRSLGDQLSYISTFTQQPVLCPGNLRWIALCLCFELSDAYLEGKPSIAMRSWKKAALADYLLDPGDWDSIHLAAQIQGTLYSLRMLQQALKCCQAELVQRPEGLSTSDVETWLEHLSSLPPLAEYPYAVDMTDLFKRLLSGGGMLELIERTTGVSLPFPSDEKVKKKKKQQEKKTSGRQQAPKFIPGNPFSLLDADCE